MSTNKIRVGIIRVGRGQSFARGADLVGMELVAICNKWEAKLVEMGKQFGVTTYTDDDRFLEHEMDVSIVVTGKKLFHARSSSGCAGPDRVCED